jgi:hypothetical protein
VGRGKGRVEQGRYEVLERVWCAVINASKDDQNTAAKSYLFINIWRLKQKGPMRDPSQVSKEKYH